MFPFCFSNSVATFKELICVVFLKNKQTNTHLQIQDLTAPSFFSYQLHSWSEWHSSRWDWQNCFWLQDYFRLGCVGTKQEAMGRCLGWLSSLFLLPSHPYCDSDPSAFSYMGQRNHILQCTCQQTGISPAFSHHYLLHPFSRPVVLNEAAVAVSLTCPYYSEYESPGFLAPTL